MGAAGAAIATVAAQAVSVIISLAVIRKRQLPFEFSRKFIRFDKNIILTEIRLGAPGILSVPKKPWDTES